MSGTGSFSMTLPLKEPTRGARRRDIVVGKLQARLVGDDVFSGEPTEEPT